jgi:hypothetical protein
MQIATVRHLSPRGRWTYCEWRPAHLADTVELLWLSDGVSYQDRDRHVPSPSVELLVNLGGDRFRLLEPVPDQPGSSPYHTMIAGTDLNMLIVTGGKERTEAEFRALLAAAGLPVTRIVQTPATMSVIEARPA